MKLGAQASAARRREEIFIAAYIAGGCKNAAEAARKAGFAEATANRQAIEILKRQRVKDKLAEHAKKLCDTMNITAERTLREAARIAYFDPAKLYDSAGNLKKVIDLDEDTRAAIASIELTPIMSRGQVVGVRKKVQHWSKTEALDKLFRHLGLFERDNAQQAGFADRLVKARERARQRV